MNDTEIRRLAYADYWNERYNEVRTSDGQVQDLDQRAQDQEQQQVQVHEWFRSFKDLEPFFDEYLFQFRRPETKPRILHLGSGDSTIPADLLQRGYNNQICLDFSEVVVKMMSRRHSANTTMTADNPEGGIQWIQGDVRDMKMIPSESTDIAFDKGTLDAMIHGSPWDPPDDVVKNTRRYMNEVFRVLNPDGRFIYVTYRQPHFVKPLIGCMGTDWDMKVVTLGGHDSSFEYYGFVIEKRRRPPPEERRKIKKV